MVADREKPSGRTYPIYILKRSLFMNCLCNLFDNNSFLWILIIAILLLCCTGCGSC